MSRTPDEHPMVIVLIDATPDTASLVFAAHQIGVQLDAIDPAFGVLPVDPANGLYSVLVRADALPPEFEKRLPFRGPFSNPSIET
jgi:hypothetical protein